MKIVMEKRKPGIYAQWYNILGRNLRGQLCHYLIYPNQAKTYAQAVRFFNETWGKNGHIAYELRNSEPFEDILSLAC